MIQRRKVAIAFACSIPIFLGFLLFELATLYRLNAQEREMVQEASQFENLNAALLSLQDVENSARIYFANPNDHYRSDFDAAAAHLVQSVRNLVQQQDHNAETQTRVRNLQESLLKVLGVLQHDIDHGILPKNNKGATLVETPASGLSADMRERFADVLADERTRFDLQQGNAARTASTLDALVKYGGALIIWILGVAALLLIYDDRNQIREQLDHRLHTDILESLPLPVCLTSDSGVILYVNPAAEEVFGYQPGELVARNIEQLHPPRESASGPQIPELLAQLLPHEIWSGELSLVGRDGDVIKTDSCMANLRVGEKDCRLLLHKPLISAKGQAQTHLAAQFKVQREAAEGTSTRPRALVRSGSVPTRSPHSEAIGISDRTK